MRFNSVDVEGKPFKGMIKGGRFVFEHRLRL